MNAEAVAQDTSLLRCLFNKGLYKQSLSTLRHILAACKNTIALKPLGKVEGHGLECIHWQEVDNIVVSLYS